MFPNNLPDCIPEDSLVGGPRTCGYDTIGEMFGHLLPNLGSDGDLVIQPADNDWQSKGILRKFSQNEMLESYIWNLDGLDDYGYIYIPA